MYRKLKRVWSHNDMNYIPRFRETFPELNKVLSEELCDRWISLGIDFYTDEKVETPIWIRLTLPFALMLMLLMLLIMPINFIITGNWGYSLGNKNRILNWFKALKLT
jgi:hypothetical protein